MSRLKPVNVNDDYGYISRVDGDRQLSDHTTQETFFEQLDTKYALQPLCPIEQRDTKDLADVNEGRVSDTVLQVEAKCLSSLRKLREGIIASNRMDPFAIEVFEKTTRYAIIHNHTETYFPVLQHLNNILYPATYTTSMRIQEQYVINDLLALHLCSQNKFGEALEIRQQMSDPRDRLVDKLIRAQIHGDWTAWNRLLKRTNILQFRLAEKSAIHITQQALKSIASSYMKVNNSWLQDICGKDWQTRLEVPFHSIEQGNVVFKRGKSIKPTLNPPIDR